MTGADGQGQGGAPRRLSMTVGTLGLIVVNLAVWLIMVASGVSFLGPEPTVMLDWGGGFAPLTLGGQPWRLFTAMFLHYGILHVGMNMLVLGQAGVLAERLVGTVYFIASYLVAGLVGALASALFNTTAVSAGASGAVFGVYGLLLGWVLRHRGLIPEAAVKQTLRMAGAFFLYNLPIGLVPNVDMAAHLGGALGGFLCGLAVPGAARIKPMSVPRSLITLAVGAAITVGATYAKPAPPLPAYAVPEFQAFVKAEKEVLSRYNQHMATVLRSREMEAVYRSLIADEERLTTTLGTLDRAKASNAEYSAVFKAYATETAPAQRGQLKGLQAAGDKFHGIQAYLDYVTARGAAATAIQAAYDADDGDALEEAFAQWRGAVAILETAGAASDAKTQEVLESYVVPRWREQTDALEALKERGVNVDQLDAFLPYVQARMRGFDSLLSGLKTKDRALVEEGYRLQAEAGRMAAELGGQ